MSRTASRNLRRVLIHVLRICPACWLDSVGGYEAVPVSFDPGSPSLLSTHGALNKHRHCTRLHYRPPVPRRAIARHAISTISSLGRRILHCYRRRRCKPCPRSAPSLPHTNPRIFRRPKSTLPATKAAAPASVSLPSRSRPHQPRLHHRLAGSLLMATSLYRFWAPENPTGLLCVLVLSVLAVSLALVTHRLHPSRR